MRKSFALALTLLVLLGGAFAAYALAISIQGPTTVWVPYGQCASATWTTSPSSLDSYSWTWNGNIVSTSSSYGNTWCSPELDYVTTDNGTLAVYGTLNGSGDYASEYIRVIFEAGDDEGGCGTQIICE